MSRETHIPAKSFEACPYTRVSQSHVNQERPKGSSEPSGQGAQASSDELTSVILRRLKKRAEFLRVAKGLFIRRKLFVIQALDRKDDTHHIGEGFTTTKKIGNAVIRNRARRRMRVLSRELLPQYGKRGFDYVFIARVETATAPWSVLLDDAKLALVRLHDEKYQSSKPRSPRRKS